jgi:hypothetical protein
LGHSERLTFRRSPTASTSPPSPPPPCHHHNTPGQRRLFFLNGDHQTTPYRDIPSIHEAVAGSGRSEHRNVDILIPVARQRESLAGPNVPCERRTDPAEPPPPTSPQRQPQHSATATQVWPPRGYAAFLQNAPIVRHTPGFHPGLVSVAPLGHSKRLTFPRAPTASASPRLPAPSPQHIGSTMIVFPQRRPSNHSIQGHTLNPRSGSGIGPERA